jgi:hypothetical protein
LPKVEVKASSDGPGIGDLGGDGAAPGRGSTKSLVSEGMIKYVYEVCG